jgi:hypothetical protein
MGLDPAAVPLSLVVGALSALEQDHSAQGLAQVPNGRPPGLALDKEEASTVPAASPPSRKPGRQCSSRMRLRIGRA